MSASNLLNLNVDTLFEQHSVPEIEIVRKKVQEVVEQKREELRTMVGERYRDLLQAADTITAMQTSSGTLISQVDCITANCRNLNEQQLIGFKTHETQDLLRSRSTSKQLNNYFSTMVQIKLLTALPELIWSHIDQEHFYAATELFIFSRHISTGLQLDANNPLMHRLPVARKQWEILKPFHLTIKQSVVAVLEREELSAVVAVDCLLSLLLLEKSNLNEVFKTFLQLRCAAFLSCLTESNDMERRRVKERILASLKVLNGTMQLVGKCFLENGLLQQQLAEHADASAPPTIALMDSNDAQFSYMMPEIISNFRPKFETQTLNASQVKAALEQWLNDTKRIASIQLKQLFELVPSMNMIQEIKTAANVDRKNLNFTAIEEQFKLTQTLDFYELKYVPLINQRIHDIIQQSWTQTMHTTFEALKRALANIADSKSEQIWHEHINDLPLSLEQALNDDGKIKKLLMKTKGYTCELIQLCSEFDAQLACIVNEMNALLEEQTARAEDKLVLIEFLRETAQAQLTGFITNVKSLQLKQEQRAELLLVVRTCVALVELCPHLKICFCQRSNWRQWIGNVAINAHDSWQRICQLLEEEALVFWHKIISGILEEHHCTQYLPQNMTHDVVLQDFAHWETIKQEQQDEQDNSIHSTFRIPNQPRISLQAYIFALIQVLNNCIPQTLPTRVLHAFNQKLLQQLLQYYAGLLTTSSTNTTTTTTLLQNSALSQNVALQLYFDLRFLQSIFAISRDERQLHEQFHSLQNSFKELIDPFDFELFAEQININVKRAVARLNCQFGLLTPAAAALTTNAFAAAPTLAQEKDPNVLSLSSSGSTTLWFPLLPIITPNASLATASMQDSRKMTTSHEAEKQTTPTRKTTAAAAVRKSETTKSSKTGASSFFGAMSQEWFR